MRILILNWKDLAHPAAGGAEVFTAGVARELASRDHAVTMFVSAVEGKPADEWVDGVRIVRRGGRLGVYRAARRFWQQEGDGQFDVVLDEVNTRPFLTPRYIRSTPVVALIHQIAKEVWRYEVPRPIGFVGEHLFEPRWLRTYRDTPVLTISASSAASFRPYGIEHASIVPLGTDPVVPPVVPKEAAPTVIFVARLVESKRPDHAVRAFELLRQQVPGAQLWMIGDGPYRAQLERIAPPGVHVLGRVSMAERDDRLARAHVLVATSVREGWGLTVSEAAALGTPSIGYRSPGLVDSVPASGGHLVDERPEALGAALTDLFEGRLPLRPTESLVPWSVVADVFEEHLGAAIARGSRRR